MMHGWHRNGSGIQLEVGGEQFFDGRENRNIEFGGSVCGITISYILGRTFGLSLIHKYGKYLRITEAHVEKAHAWFRRAGHWSLTVGYFIPGVRHFTAYAAGMSDLEYPTFSLFAYAGAAIWAGSFITLGYFLGERWQAVQAHLHHVAVIIALAVLLLAAAWLAWRKWFRQPRP